MKERKGGAARQKQPLPTARGVFPAGPHSEEELSHLRRCWKACDKLQYPIVTQNLSDLRIERNFLNLKKNLPENYSKHRAHWKTLKAFPLRSGTRQGCPFSSLSFSIVQEVSQCSKASEGGREIGKGKVKPSLCIDSMIVYVENSSECTIKTKQQETTLELICEFSEVSGYNISTQIFYCYTLAMNTWKPKF